MDVSFLDDPFDYIIIELIVSLCGLSGLKALVGSTGFRFL
jgi:hypothetical protein